MLVSCFSLPLRYRVVRSAPVSCWGEMFRIITIQVISNSINNKIVNLGMMRERSEGEDSSEPSGDPEMVPVYVRTLLPIFCRTFQSSLIGSVKRAALGIIMKMVHYVDKDLLGELSHSDVGSDVVQVLAGVLDTEDDEEGHLLGLYIIHDLMQKSSGDYL